MRIFSAILILIFTISASQGVSVEDCITNSKNENFEFQLWVKRYDLINCLGNEIGITYVQDLTHYVTVKNEEAIHKFVADDCPKIKDSLRCLEGYMDDLRQCFIKDEPELDLIKSFQTRVKGLLDIFCDNEGENLIELSRNNGSNLFGREADILLKPCMNSWIGKSIAMFQTHDPIFEASDDTKEATADLRQCFLDAANTLQFSKAFVEKFFDAADADLLRSLVSMYTYEPGFKTIQKMSPDFQTSISEKYTRQLVATIIELYKGDETKREMVEFLKKSQ